MGSRGSEFGRRRRDNVVNLFKELDAAFDKAYVATDGNTKEENEANLKAYNELWNKVYDAGLADGYIDWLKAGKPNDWKPNDNKEPEPTPASETEQREQERRESEPEPETNNTENNAPSPYSQDRLDNGFNAKTAKAADNKLLPETQRVWKDLTDQEKIVVRSYSGKLAGELNTYLWEGKEVHGGYDNITDTYYEGDVHQPLDLLTSAINKSELKQDTWLERGIDMDQLHSFFGINDVAEITDVINEGKIVTHKGFMSTTSGDIQHSYAKGHGVLLKIFAPKGTKGMYVNPVSKYGDKLFQIGYNNVVGAYGKMKKVSKIEQDWDGQTSHAYGSEIETILQRGLNFRVLKQEVDKGKLVVTIAVAE